MRIRIINSKRTQGSILFTSLALLSIVAIGLGALVSGVQQESRVNERMIAWKSALPIAEAGVEEALAHLNVSSSLQTNDWFYIATNKTYRKKRTLDEGYFEVEIATNTPPTIRSTGWVKAPLETNFISRTIEVKTKIRRSAGIEVKDSIDCNGNGILDSFDSTDPNFSTAGQYDPTKAKDECHLKTLSSGNGNISVGNRSVYGRVFTGKSGVVKLGGGKVGSKSWIARNDTSGKIEPGRYNDGYTSKFLPVEAPFTSGLQPASIKILTITYPYVFANGDYSVDTIKLSGSDIGLVNGKARVYVKGDISMTGSSSLVIQPGASLEIYCAGKSIHITGGGILNQTGRALSLKIYALPSVSDVDYGGSASLIGVIYAPNSNVKLSGSTVAIGHIKSESADITGNSIFHADESLGTPTYVIGSWTELVRN